VSRKLPLAVGETSRTACARGLLRRGEDEATGELLSAAVLAERVGWAPEQDRDGPHHRRDGHPLGDRHTRSQGGHQTGRFEDQPEGPVQDRAHPGTHHTPRAQATQGTLPHQTLGPGGQASGGTRSHGPDPAAPRSPPAPGRDHDQHTHHRSPTTRSGTGRGVPPACSRHPSTVGRSPARQHV
jgi:hypothetical protein